MAGSDVPEGPDRGGETMLNCYVRERIGPVHQAQKLFYLLLC